VIRIPERLECEVLQNVRYINTLTFTFYLSVLTSLHWQVASLSDLNVFGVYKQQRSPDSITPTITSTSRKQIADKSRACRRSRDLRLYSNHVGGGSCTAVACNSLIYSAIGLHVVQKKKKNVQYAHENNRQSATDTGLDDIRRVQMNTFLRTNKDKLEHL